MENTINIRRAEPKDHDAILDILQTVVQGGDTFVFDPNSSKEALAPFWFAPYMHTYLAELEGKIVGSYFIKANQPGLGAHVANAGYMVDPNVRGQGLAQKMCAHSLEEAKKLGFLAMQYNIVVSSNVSAVHVWKKMGFEIIGTLPKAFNHQQLGLIDAYVMYQTL